MTSGTRVLITGVSTRAAADSAARAGFRVVSLDGFADLDQHPAVQALSLPRDFGVAFSPRKAASLASAIPADAVAYTSSFENHPAAVEALAAGCALWGNPGEVLRRVRDPFELTRSLRDASFDVPVTTRRPPDDGARPTGRWLLKPRASGGGHSVREWQPGTAVPRRHYLQKLIAGVPGSIVFVAAGGRAVPLGISRQLIGECAFGAAGYRYCGSVVSRDAFDRDDALAATLAALVARVAETFRLIGVNGLDFIASRGVPYAIEINPRWSASMEIVERAYGISVFAAHAEACTRQALPAFELSRARTAAGAHGKAIVFAGHDAVAGDTRPWLEDGNIRDVPRPGDRLPAGEPVCTVLAEGDDDAACHAALVKRAQGVCERLRSWAARAR